MEKLTDILNKVVAGIKSEILLFSIAIIILLVITPAEFKFFILGIYVIGILGFIVYARVVNKPLKEQSRLSVHADLVRSNHYTQVEILNTGSEDIINVRVDIRWNQREGEQNRNIRRFFREGENPITMSASEIRSLRVGERVFASDIPLYSVDGQIHVTISGEGAVTHNPLNYTTVVANEARQN